MTGAGISIYVAIFLYIVSKYNIQHDLFHWNIKEHGWEGEERGASPPLAPSPRQAPPLGPCSLPPHLECQARLGGGGRGGGHLELGDSCPLGGMGV